MGRDGVLIAMFLGGAALLVSAARVRADFTNTLQSVSPSSAPQGADGLVVTFTLKAAQPPGADVQVRTATIGTIAGAGLSRPTLTTVVGTFNIPGQESAVPKDVTVRFQGPYVGFKAGGFTVTAASNLLARFSATPTNGVPPLSVTFTDDSIGEATNRLWDFGDAATSAAVHPVHTYARSGRYTVSLTVWGPLGSNTATQAGCVSVASPPANGAYVVVDTGQTNCYDNAAVIAPPATGQPFFGQDAQCAGHAPAYRDNGDGTVADLNTGLMWVQARGAKIAWEDALTNAAVCAVGGYTDWRMPTIKELYSLIEFTGANGQGMTSSAGYLPFIDTNHFGFAYGGASTNVGDRIIDCQDWSATKDVSTTMNGSITIFGVNFADGRIKGYPQFNPGTGAPQTMYVRYVRGNPDYGLNHFLNNGDGTISDKGTGLMWTRDDSGVGLNWSNALAYAQARNAANYLGHSDWRLPNVKEMQSIVDYSRSPGTTGSAAINPVFNCTGITNEAGAADFPFYFTGTTLVAGPGMAEGVYVCFGRAMGYDNGTWVDVHGAGAQRSDPKSGNPADYPNGRGPQGDAVRIYNYVRLVRDIPATTAWRFAFVGDTHVPLTTIPAEIASAVADDDVKFLIVAGDLTQSGARASTNTLTGELTTWRSEMQPLADRGIPVYVVRGNHENDVTNGLAAWLDFFSGADAMPGNGPVGESNLTYSLTYSNALFLAFDQYVNIHRINQTWLDDRLAANTRPLVFAFGHEPAFKTFHTDCLDDDPTNRNAFWSRLAAAGAKVYLCGHDHLFNVARIDDGDGNPANDLYQCIVGTGGSTNWIPQAYHYNGDNAPYTPVNVANVTNAYGYLIVEISGPGDGDLGVTLTWKQRTYDPQTGSYIYVAVTNVLAYTAVNRYLDSIGDGIPDWWRALYFGGDGTRTNASSCATGDPDQDGADNRQEYLADTNPTNGASRLAIMGVAVQTNDVQLTWIGGRLAWQYLECCSALASNAWTAVFTNAPPTTISNTLVRPCPAGESHWFYRIEAGR